MNHWLIKSEPDVYSYDTLLKDGKGTWDGVRNYQARNNLKEMKVGDLALFYHSNIGKEVVGIAQIIKEHYPDPTTDDARWVVVDIAPFQKLKKGVSLELIKKDPLLQNIHLVRQGRLSVMSLSKEEFDHIVSLSES
jgi:predicted RNA-binding protein with PUA-like domain